MTPLIAFIGMQGFAALVAILGVGALAFQGRTAPANLGVAILLCLVAWAAISMTWSPASPAHPNFRDYREIEPLTGVKLVFELALYGAFVFGMQSITPQTAARASLFLSAALAVLVAAVTVEFFDGAAVYQAIKAAVHEKMRPDFATRNVARGCYVVAVLFWPATLRLRRALIPALAALLAAGFLMGALAFRVDAPVLALVLSSLAFAAVYAFGVLAVWGVLACAVIYFACAPLVAALATSHSPALASSIAKQSWQARVEIWHFASAQIIQNPLRGWGLEASRAWPGQIPMHPHNAALQIWLELGATGAVFAALFWAWLFTRIAEGVRQDKTMGAAACASAVAYLTIGALSFGVWQEWWLAVGALAIVFCGFVSKSRVLDNETSASTGLTALHTIH